ncbi:unnamed protein product [Schistocephalus solidus]|uniref:Derlin n=1 Tax=Schistocephalus solidus TaxID=70667 RepID=A0A183SZ21_SCHSO|nr:unnamed protein product [Schistocephalus solidus]
MDELRHEIANMPPITKYYAASCLFLSIAVVCKLFSLWRLITCFCFFGHIDFNFFFNMYFVYRYCRMLEENYYYGRSADFLMMFIFGGCLSLIAGIFLQMLFLSHVLTMMLVYVWSRRSPSVRLNIMGLFTVNAPYLPWVFFAISYLLGNNASVDFVGKFISFPQGFKILRTPTVLYNLLDGRRDDPAYRPLPEERPGGFDWGAN